MRSWKPAAACNGTSPWSWGRLAAGSLPLASSKHCSIDWEQNQGITGQFQFGQEQTFGGLQSNHLPQQGQPWGQPRFRLSPHRVLQPPEVGFSLSSSFFSPKRASLSSPSWGREEEGGAEEGSQSAGEQLCYHPCLAPTNHSPEVLCLQNSLCIPLLGAALAPALPCLAGHLLGLLVDKAIA